MSKKVIKFLLALVLLGFLAVALILWNINPIVESFRPKLTQLISDTIHQPVEIGSIKLNLFPTQEVELGDLSLGGTKSGANVGRVMLGVDIMKLFHKQLEVSEVIIDKVTVTITREADGSLKVGGVPLGQAQPKAEEKTAPAPAPGTPAAGAPGAPPEGKADTSSIQFHTKTFRLKNSSITVEDKKVSPPQTIQLADLDVSVNNITQDAIEKFSIDASFLGKSKDNFKLKGSVKGLTKAPFGLEPDLSLALLKVDLAKLAPLAAAYGTKIKDLSLKETVDIELKVKGSTMSPHVDFSFNGKPAEISFGNLFEKPAGSNLKLEASLAHEATNISVPSLVFGLGESTISMPMNLNPLNRSGKIQVKAPDLKLADLAKYLPMLRPFGLAGSVAIDFDLTMPDVTAGGMPLPKGGGTIELKGIGATTTLPGDGEKRPEPLVVKDVNGKVELKDDTSILKGLKMNVAGQALELGVKTTGLPLLPAVQYALRAPHIDFGPLLKAVKPGGIDAVNGSSIDGLEVQGGFDKKTRAGNVSLVIAKGDLASLPLGAAKIAAEFSLDQQNKPQKAVLQPSNLAIFGGTAQFQGSLSPEQVVSFQMKASKIDIKKAMDTVRPGSKISMTGTMDNLSVQITAKQSAPADTLAGPVSLSVSNGSIEGINIVGQALAKVDVIPGLGAALLAFIPEKYAPLFKGDRTVFDQLSVDAQLNGGNTTLNSFKIAHAAYAVSGEGTLPKSGDFEIHAQLTLTADLARGMVEKQPKLKLLLDEQGGIVFPITILKRGGVPIVIPDVTKLAKSALRNTAKDAATKVLDQGLEKVAPGLGKVAPGIGGALDSLFK